jgi:parvulin-like peptidyl-prolyl isomerase
MRVSAWLREPLVHFVALGAMLFAVDRARHGPVTDRETVRIDDAVARGLRDELARRNGRPPSESEVRAMVEGYVDDEVLYREALALGLERGDPIVRRRLIQKMELAVQADAQAQEPTDDALRALLAEEPARWTSPATTSLSHVFFDPARRADAEGDARHVAEVDAPRGDPFIAAGPLHGLRGEAIDATFGEGFAPAVDALPVGRWSAPMRSRYGWHLLRVDARSPGAAPPLDEVRGALRARWIERDQARRRREALDALRTRYRVEVSGTPAPVSVATR